MENKKIVSAGEMSKYLIGYWLLWGLLFGFIYSIVFNLITSSIESLVLKAIIAVISQGVVAIIIWKFSTSSSFKKRTISNNDIPTVMKNLIIFTIIFCVITGIYNIARANSLLNKSINSNVQLNYIESKMSKIYSEEQIAKYKKEKEETISAAKSKVNKYLIILEVGLTVVYLAVLPLEKKEIIKYVS